MNIASADPTAPPPQPQLPASGCPRHPTEQFTGFCPSCLFDRLNTLDSSSAAAPSSALKSLFSGPNKLPPHPPPPLPKPTSSFLPELRRTKSFSASRNEALRISTEPHRKSCDVRPDQTLLSLFSDADGKKNHNPNYPRQIHSKSIEVLENIEIEDDLNNPGDEIRPVQDTHFEISLVNNNSEIVEENAASVNNFTKPIAGKKSSGGGLWAAASVFSKKWRNWRRNQKTKKHTPHPGKGQPTPTPATNPYGRRSVDIDTRHSLDAARISFDDVRYSLDETRASCDGYLTGKSFPRMQLDEPNFISKPERLPGSTAHTRDYYLDSSSKRKKSFELERSTSIRQTAAAVVAEIEDLKMGSNANANANAKVLQTTTIRDDSGEKKEKSKKWSWKIWGFKHRKNHKEGDEEEKSSGLNVVDRSLSQSWQEMQRGDHNSSMVRSNSSVSWRRGNRAEGERRLSVDKKRSGEIVLDKNRNNARYSPNNLDNGLLRFYLTPRRSSPRRGGTGKVKPTNSNPIARRVY